MLLGVLSDANLLFVETLNLLSSWIEFWGVLHTYYCSDSLLNYRN